MGESQSKGDKEKLINEGEKQEESLEKENIEMEIVFDDENNQTEEKGNKKYFFGGDEENKLDFEYKGVYTQPTLKFADSVFTLGIHGEFDYQSENIAKDYKDSSFTLK